MPTCERLDRCLGNAKWCRTFPSTTVYHLHMMYSDHAPIPLLVCAQWQRPNKPFRFENWWLIEQDFQETAHLSWQHSSNHPFSHKTRFLAADLKKWRKKKPKNSDQLANIEAQILVQQSLHRSNQNHTLQHQLQQQHQSLLAKEAYHIKSQEEMGRQRWSNTEFFHLAIIKRNWKNRISHLNPDGSYSPAQISCTLTNYVQSIFTSSSPQPKQPTTHPHTNHSSPHQHTPTSTISSLPPFPPSSVNSLPDPPHSQPTNPTSQHITTDQSPHSNTALFNYTYSIPDLKELQAIITKMRSEAAQGPDGLNAAF